MLAHDRRHAFGPWVFAAAAAYFLLHLYNILYMLNEPENPAILVWRFSGSMGLVPDAMPLVAALPAAAAFAVDLNSGFAVPAVFRAGTGRYLRSKVLAACIGGGLAPLLGRLAFVVFLHILYRGDVAMAAEMFGPDGAIGAAFNGVGGYIGYFAGVLFVQFIAGAFWAMAALAFSAYVPNVLWTVCLPLILHRLFLELDAWTNLPTWLNLSLLQDQETELAFAPGLLTAVGIFGALIAIAVLLFYRRGKRRLTYA